MRLVEGDGRSVWRDLKRVSDPEALRRIVLRMWPSRVRGIEAEHLPRYERWRDEILSGTTTTLDDALPIYGECHGLDMSLEAAEAEEMAWLDDPSDYRPRHSPGIDVEARRHALLQWLLDVHEDGLWGALGRWSAEGERGLCKTMMDL